MIPGYNSVLCGHAYSAGVLEADDGDKESNTYRDGRFQILWDIIYKRLSEVSEREQYENDSFYADCSERYLPRFVRAYHRAYCVREVGVEAHAGSKRYGVIGEECHKKRSECS